MSSCNDGGEKTKLYHNVLQRCVPTHMPASSTHTPGMRIPRYKRRGLRVADRGCFCLLQTVPLWFRADREAECVYRRKQRRGLMDAMWDGGCGRCLLMPSLHVGGVSGDARSRGQASCTAAREEEVPFSFALPPIHPWTLRLSCRWVWRAHSSHTGDPRQLCAKEGEGDGCLRLAVGWCW